MLKSKWIIAALMSAMALSAQAQVGTILKGQQTNGTLVDVAVDTNGRLSTTQAAALVDKSGSIAVASTAQTVAVANTTRKFLYIQNNSAGDLWINFGSAAVLSQPSIKLATGQSFVMENGVISNQSLSIIGATVGQTFTVKEL